MPLDLYRVFVYHDVYPTELSDFQFCRHKIDCFCVLNKVSSELENSLIIALLPQNQKRSAIPAKNTQKSVFVNLNVTKNNVLFVSMVKVLFIVCL